MYIRDTRNKINKFVCTRLLQMLKKKKKKTKTISTTHTATHAHSDTHTEKREKIRKTAHFSFARVGVQIFYFLSHLLLAKNHLCSFKFCVFFNFPNSQISQKSKKREVKFTTTCFEERRDDLTVSFLVLSFFFSEVWLSEKKKKKKEKKKHSVCFSLPFVVCALFREGKRTSHTHNTHIQHNNARTHTPEMLSRSLTSRRRSALSLLSVFDGCTNLTQNGNQRGMFRRFAKPFSSDFDFGDFMSQLKKFPSPSKQQQSSKAPAHTRLTVREIPYAATSKDLEDLLRERGYTCKSIE